MTRLLLARHGETEWNADGRIQGYHDVPLNGRGRAQAEELGRRLRESGEKIERCYSSPKIRALETARIACRALELDEITIVEDLREVSFGAWEGRTWAQVEAQWPAEYAAYQADRRTVRPPEGESYGELRARVLPALARLQNAGGGTALVACHSAVISSVRAFLDGVEVLDNRFLSRCKLDNGAWIALDRPLQGGGIFPRPIQ